VRETKLTQHKNYKPEVSFHCVPECGTGNLSLKTKCMLCVSTFLADGNNTEDHTTFIFLKKLYFGDSNL